MLRHTALKLAERKLTERDAWVYLEAFLVHFRNLIEFLGNEKPRRTDLHVTNVWQLENLDEPVNMKDLHQQGKQLWQKYEPKEGARISQYLHHCTARRVESKDWPVPAMMKDIEPLLRDVEKYLRKKHSALEPIPPVKGLTYFSASTTTMTSTSSLLTQPEKLFVKMPKDFE
ncbi:MAG TPA: hypothetical protein VGS15_06060 [Candidatus Acidoferrales bacterium]|nr:hypothetical protein [Candidatus Acidoferrales bacterium]